MCFKNDLVKSISHYILSKNALATILPVILKYAKWSGIIYEIGDGYIVIPLDESRHRPVEGLKIY